MMRITVAPGGHLLLEEVFSGIELKTRDGETIGICMRDSGFEFTYEGKAYSAQKGVITEVQISDPDPEIDTEPHSPGPA